MQRYTKTNRQHPKRIWLFLQSKYWYYVKRSTIFLIILSIIIVAMVIMMHASIHVKRSVASYKDYHTPVVRLSKNIAQPYAYRLHPKHYHYTHAQVIVQRHQIPHYIYHIGKYYLSSGTRTILHKKIVYVPIKYHIRNVHNHVIDYVHNNYPIWNEPYVPGAQCVSTTNGLAKVQQAISIIKVAKYRSYTFYEIMSGGHVYGWIPKDAIQSTNMYQIPFHYYSQLQPYYAPDACEAVSLRMALSAKGRDPKMSMKKFIKKIPRNPNPEKGYNHNPLKLGDSAAIFPKALAKYAHKYDRHAYAYTGIGKRRIIYELKHGNPVIFEGSYHMKDIDSDHTLVLVGYCKGDFKFADPYYKKGWHEPISWVSIHKFTKLFHQPLRGARAVVIK